MTQLETVHNTGKSSTSGVSLLSRLLVVFFAAMVSLALPAIALAQQSAKPGQQTQGVIVARLLANPQPHSGKIYHLTGPQSENMNFLHKSIQRRWAARSPFRTFRLGRGGTGCLSAACRFIW